MSDAGEPSVSPESDAPIAGATTLEAAARADELIRKYMLGALGVGLIPIPIVDTAAVAAIQLQLLSRLAELYEVDFSSQIGKSLIASLVGGGMPVLASGVSSRLLTGLFPLQGRLAITLSMSAFAGASTYAVGKVFVQHFGSGGTFLTFDPAKVREYYEQQLARGREEVRTSFAGVKP